MRSKFDVVCIGGGVVGLAVAYELAGRGIRAAVVDRAEFGAESSWAGAGILPPASPSHRTTAYDRLRAESAARYPALAAELAESTGVDVGFRCTGGLFVPHDETPEQLAAALQTEGIEVSHLTAEELRVLEPELCTNAEVLWLPGVSQVRNPRLVKALVAACTARGVAMFANAEVVEVLRDGDSVQGVRLADERQIKGDATVLSAGAWSTAILEPLGVRLPLKPIRGQIVLYKTRSGLVRHVIEIGKEYLVPREDGLVLVGSTEEDVGFDKSNTAGGIAALRQFAESLYPALRDAAVVRTWAGLRPATDLGSPIIGQVDGLRNLWLATGHFRNGVQLAPGTALLIADWLTGHTSFATPSDFSLSADRREFRTAFVS